MPKVNGFIYLLCWCIVYLSMGCSDDDEPVVVDRTVLIYMAGDNNLDGDAHDNLQHILDVRNHIQGRLIVYWDSPDGAKLIEIESDGENNIGDHPVLKDYGRENSASAEVLQRVISETKTIAPANSYGLLLWSHGTGWLPQERESLKSRSFGADHGSEINLPKLAGAIADHAFEYIIFDACLMGGVEVFYELRNKCNYIIASPHLVITDGLPYRKIVPLLWGGVEDLKKICEEYYTYYQSQSNSESRSATTALIRTSGMEGLYSVCQTILQGRSEEIARLSPESVYYYYIRRIDLPEYFRKMFFDLDDFIAKVASVEQYEEFKTYLSHAVVQTWKTDYFFNVRIEKFCGMSVYIPLSKWAGLNTYYFSNIAWAKVYTQN